MDLSSIKDFMNNMDIYRVELLDKDDLFAVSNYWCIIGSTRVKILEKISFKKYKNTFPKELKKKIDLINDLSKIKNYSKMNKSFILEDIKYAHSITCNSIPSKKSSIELDDLQICTELSKHILDNILKNIKKLQIKFYIKKVLTRKVNTELKLNSYLKSKYLY